jgi:membrane-bound lytic murein transglycosylase A
MRHAVRWFTPSAAASSNVQPVGMGTRLRAGTLMNSDKVNMQTMKEFLEENPKIRDYVLNKNKSYVFFKFNEKEGIFGNIGLSLTAKESVAMDNELLPKGALAFIKTVVPKKIEGQKVVARTEREPFEKFVMVQDTGGAIRGGGRVDIYFGEGDEALFYAGQTASKGEVYLLVAKKESLNHITK